MSTTIQTILSSIIVAAAVFLAARSIYRAIRCRKSVLTTCAECPLASKCNKPLKQEAEKKAGKNS